MQADHERMTRVPRKEFRNGRVRRWLVRSMVSVGFIALGVIGSMVFLPGEGKSPVPLVGTAAPPPAAEPLSATVPAAVETTNDTEVDVVLSPKAVARAGIKTAQVSTIEPRLSIEVPVVVMANAYREVKVTPLVGSIVRKVHAELGAANFGQVVGMGEELFVVTDLSAVWVVGDLYEQGFQQVRVGSETTFTTPAYPELTLRGRVSYIDPRLDLQTRTAKVRVEVPNPNRSLRLGMYMTMSFSTPGGALMVVVPRAAIQTIGARYVVFVPVEREEGCFLQRTIQLGRMLGESYTVLKGLEPGAMVVTEGSFFLRAESLRNAPSG